MMSACSRNDELQHPLDQHRQPVDALAHVGVAEGQVDLHARRKKLHDTPSSLPRNRIQRPVCNLYGDEHRRGCLCRLLLPTEQYALCYPHSGGPPLKWTLTKPRLNSLFLRNNSLILKIFSLLICVGNCARSRCRRAVSCYGIPPQTPKIAIFPVKFPVSREFAWRPVRSALRRQPGSPTFRYGPHEMRQWAGN